jgi:hypothetical protein
MQGTCEHGTKSAVIWLGTFSEFTFACKTVRLCPAFLNRKVDNQDRCRSFKTALRRLCRIQLQTLP